MNLVTEAPAWLFALLFAALAAAGIEDFIRLRISNITCGAVFVTALIAMTLQGFPLDLWENAVVFIVVLLCGTPLYAARKIGGGDVKLLASVGLWVNMAAGVWLIVTTLVAGGVLAIIYIVIRYLRPPSREKRKESQGIPYALAIVAGASIIFAGQLRLMKQSPQPPNPFQLSAVN